MSRLWRTPWSFHQMCMPTHSIIVPTASEPMIEMAAPKAMLSSHVNRPPWVCTRAGRVARASFMSRLRGRFGFGGHLRLAIGARGCGIPGAGVAGTRVVGLTPPQLARAVAAFHALGQVDDGGRQVRVADGVEQRYPHLPQLTAFEQRKGLSLGKGHHIGGRDEGNRLRGDAILVARHEVDAG